MADARFTRQVRLSEVGEEGQAKLLAAEVCVETGAAGEVLARYLAGAGVRVVRAGAPHPPEEETPMWLEELHPAAREVGVGAYGALRAIRSILGAG